MYGFFFFGIDGIYECIFRIMNQNTSTRIHSHMVRVLIMKTCPCNIQRFFLAVKIENINYKLLIFFLIFAQNIYCGYTLEPPRRGGSNEYPQYMFWSKNKKNRCFTI